MPLPSPVGFAPTSSYEGAGGCRGDTGSVMACLAPQPQLSPLVQEDLSPPGPPPHFPSAGIPWPSPWWPGRAGPGLQPVLVPRPILCLEASWAGHFRQGLVRPAAGWSISGPTGPGTELGKQRRVAETGVASAVSRKWVAGVVTLRTYPSLTHPPPPPRDHAGPLRLCAAADPHRGAHPRRPPVSQLRCPCLWPCAVCRQLPRPPGPLEAASAPEEEQSPVTLAPGHRLPINSLGTSSGLISASSHGAYLRLVGQEAWG